MMRRRAPLHYRAYLPRGVSVAVAVAVMFTLFPMHWLAMRAGSPPYLTAPLVYVVPLLVPSFVARDVVLSSDGRLTVTGFGQHIDVDVRLLTEINLPAGARYGFGLAQIRWNDGGFQMWPAMTYLPDHRHRFRKGPPFANVSADFRDLIYRLHLINPSTKIHGIDLPAKAPQLAPPRPPTPY